EAVEAAFKFARLSTSKPGIVAAMRSFHGRTLGALSATWEPEYRTPFEPLIPGVRHVPYNKTAALDAALDNTTAALILEVVQGEGGVNLGQAEYLQTAQQLCRERNILLIVDEVQTGFGRTGRLWACQHYGLQPDIMCAAKGIAGGVPMGAVLLGERVRNIKPGVHGSTFGGNPLACAAALAAIDVIQSEGLAEASARKGAWALQRLRSIQSPLIREVRGLGLMLGIELRQKVTPYLKALMAEGVLALPAGNTVMRLLPPLVISDDDLAQACDAIERVLSA
ncbi:MAG: aminotransferase class III-fold pyridoxal phosphate-dependent enzyme, partial [Chloroflexi bacterium]|nr:aminotransferase class III-fold pyridoxal phosphate-dependent enzyme [Chloroflexota bacterium]